MKNIYVYDKNTGFLSYSIEGTTPEREESLKRKGTSYIVAERVSLLNQYVVVDANSNPTGLAKIGNFEEIGSDKLSLIANGTDEMTFSDIPANTTVSLNGIKIWTSNSIDTTFSFSVNGYSTSNPVLAFKKYGYQDGKFPVVTYLHEK